MALAWRGVVVGMLSLLMLASTIALAQPTPRPGVEPQDAWTCPATHPIKGNFTPTDPRELCICHIQGGQYYDRTKPERCYSTDADARRDGRRKSKL